MFEFGKHSLAMVNDYRKLNGISLVPRTGGWKFVGNFHQISTPLETSTKLPPPPWKFGGSVQGVVEVFIVCTTAQAFSIVKHMVL